MSSITDFFKKHLKETLSAINSLIESRISIVDTKRIRQCLGISSSNRSKINFIWRALKKIAETTNLLELDGDALPAKYVIQSEEKVKISPIIRSIYEKLE